MDCEQCQVLMYAGGGIKEVTIDDLGSMYPANLSRVLFGRAMPAIGTELANRDGSLTSGVGRRKRTRYAQFEYFAC